MIDRTIAHIIIFGAQDASEQHNTMRFIEGLAANRQTYIDILPRPYASYDGRIGIDSSKSHKYFNQ